MPDLKLWGEQELLKLRNDMDRLFDSLCSDLGLPCLEDRGERSLSLEEDEENIVLRAKLPGFAPQDVQVTVHERGIVIEAATRQQQAGGSSSRSVRRKVELPCMVRPEKASATFHDDILEVVMPKNTTCRPSLLRLSGS